MKKIPSYRDELDDNFPRTQTESFFTLDGFVYDKDQGTFSYDSDYDETLPNILIGVKSPNEQDRKNQLPPKRVWFPRKLLSVRKKNIQFWKGEESTLSEILSVYPHLQVGVTGIGCRKAYEFIGLLVFLNHRGESLHDLPLGGEIFETIARRCKSNNYEGKWRLLSRILQIENSPTFSNYFIKEQFTEREIYGNLLPTGEKLLNQLTISISCHPVRKPNRKKGYSDKGSRKDPSQIHELSENPNLQIRETRELVPLKGKLALTTFLYGNPAPVRYIEGETPSEKNYRKRMNQDLNRLRRQEQKRIRSLSSEVTVYKEIKKE